MIFFDIKLSNKNIFT